MAYPHLENEEEEPMSKPTERCPEWIMGYDPAGEHDRTCVVIKGDGDVKFSGTLNCALTHFAFALQQLAQANARNEVLAAALKPFADSYIEYGKDWPSDVVIHDIDCYARAAEAMKGEE